MHRCDIAFMYSVLRLILSILSRSLPLTSSLVYCVFASSTIHHDCVSVFLRENLRLTSTAFRLQCYKAWFCIVFSRNRLSIKVDKSSLAIFIFSLRFFFCVTFSSAVNAAFISERISISQFVQSPYIMLQISKARFFASLRQHPLLRTFEEQNDI